MAKAIVIIGPMGVGKTTIGKKLAKKLGKDFLDTDQEIVKKHGPISEIFTNHGETTFRRFESEILVQALQSENVVATGGGAVLSKANQDAIRKQLVIYLATNGKHIGSRLAGGSRPLLKDGFQDWVKIYEARKPIYEKLASITIDTSGRPLKSILDEIQKKLANHEH